MQTVREFLALYWPWLLVTIGGAIFNAVTDIPADAWDAWAATNPRRRAFVALMRKWLIDPRGTGPLIKQLLTAKAATLPRPPGFGSAPPPPVSDPLELSSVWVETAESKEKKP